MFKDCSACTPIIFFIDHNFCKGGSYVAAFHDGASRQSAFLANIKSGMIAINNAYHLGIPRDIPKGW